MESAIQKTRILIEFIFLMFVYVHLTPCHDVSVIEEEEGKDIHLDFNFSLPSPRLTFIVLKRNGTVIYKLKRQNMNIVRSKPVELIDLEGRVRFNLRDVDTSDTGSYECFSSGVKQVPLYHLTVVPSVTEFTITDNKGLSYENNSVISVVEGRPLQLTCRFVGGLRSDWSMGWIINGTKLLETDERVNRTYFDQYHEESVLEILETDITLDGTWIRCEARGEQISVLLNIKKKPILKTTGTLTEGVTSDLICILNATVSHAPTFRWSLDGNDVTSNSSQKQIDGIWCSTFNFYPIRSYFSKQLRCTINNDEERFQSVVIELNYPSTISSLRALPSEFIELHASVNLTCQASGYPLPTLYWSTQNKQDDSNWRVVEIRHSPGRILNKTTSEISLIIDDIQKEDIGRYRCTALNELNNSDEMDIELQLEVYGILDISQTMLFENTPVNLTCLIKRQNVVTVAHITWHIGGSDVTPNATQDEIISSRGEYISRSILRFYPKREFKEMYLTCNGGREQTSIHSVYLNISYCEDKPVHNCIARANDSSAHLTCTTTPKTIRNEIEFHRNNDRLNRRFISSGKEGDGVSKVFYYDLGSTKHLLLDGYNCCISSQRCPRYCSTCEEQGYEMSKAEEESNFLLYIILVAIAVVTVIIITLCFLLMRGKRRQVPINQADRVGVRTLQAVNAGESIQASLGSLPAIYEHMGTGYTTRVHSTSEYMGDDAFDDHNDAMDNISFSTQFTEVSKMSNFCTKTMSLNEKMRKLYGLHAGVETQEKGSRLSRHFKDEEALLIDGGDSPTLQTYSLKRVQSVEETFILDLTIHNKISQRGSFFFCDATLNYKHGSLPATVKVLSEYASNKERSHFAKEIGTVKKLGHHPNVMEILGTICNSKPNCIMFVKMTGTSLKQHLIKTRESLSDVHFEKEELRLYAEGICSGMLFLSNNAFCYPSLRCETVHLAKTGVCKLYDFTPVELCDIKDGDGQAIHELVAPEITRGELHTSRTDVWAFGNLLWELYIYGLGSPSEDNTGRVYGQLIALHTQERPTSCPDMFFKLMQLCWHEDPSSRPIFSAVLTEIQDMSQRRKMSTTV